MIRGGRRIEAVTRITLPPGYHPALPETIHVKRDYATFDETYQVDKDVLIIERDVVILKRKVPKSDWQDYIAYVKATGIRNAHVRVRARVP